MAAILELFGTAQLIYGSNYKQIPLLVVASIWYLAFTSVMSVGQYFLETRFGRGTARGKPGPSRSCEMRRTAVSPINEDEALAGAPWCSPSRCTSEFGFVEVLKGIDMEVKAGEVACLLGPSGSGKSTFLRCINHLEKIDGGRLSVNGHLVGYRQKGDKLYELKDPRSRSAAGRSAWCSSGSTCSRT